MCAILLLNHLKLCKEVSVLSYLNNNACEEVFFNESELSELKRIEIP